MRINIARAHVLLEKIASLRFLSSRLFIAATAWIILLGLILGIRLLQIANLTNVVQHFPWHPWQVLSLVFLIFATTVLHEIGHGVACTYFGVPVRSMGIMLYYLQPAAFADVTDSWQLGNKWHRVAVSSAGLYVQSLVTAFAVAIGLAFRAAGHRSDLLLIFIAMNLFTIAFNLVPFVKLDGYWVISTIVAVPNLRDRALEWWRVFAIALITRRVINEKALRYNAVLLMTPLGRSLLACFGLSSTVFGSAMWLGGLGFLFRSTRWLGIPRGRSYFAVGGLLLTIGIAFVVRSALGRRRSTPVASATLKNPPTMVVTHAINRDRIVRLNPYVSVVDNRDGTFVFAWSSVDQLVVPGSPNIWDLLPALRRGISLHELASDTAGTLDSQIEEILQRLWHLKHLRYAADWNIEDEEVRYSRQLGWFSMNVATRGSETAVLSRLQKKSVAILGVGGLGSHIAWNLAACGIGELHLVDGDSVELSNLNRQLLYTPADVGRFKVEAAAERLMHFNPKLKIRTSRVFVNSVSDVMNVIGGADFVVRSLDTPQEVQMWVNEACVRKNIPSAGAGFLAQGAIVGPTVIPGLTACLFCHTAQQPPRIDRGAGATLAPVVTICAGILANEVIAYLGESGQLRTAGGMLILNAPAFETQYREVSRDNNCGVCGQKGVAV
jgi:molybdopterin/thiamine biosynthesis adenylyltransferase/Zn-dependent protease